MKSEPNRSIFRAQAVQRYLRNRAEPVLPRFVDPHTFRYLWLLLGLLIASGGIAWSTRMPINTAGFAIAFDDYDSTHNDKDAAIFIAFLPSKSHAQLRIGQTLLVSADSGVEQLRAQIFQIEPELLSPSQAQQRFAIGDSALHSTESMAVVLARSDASTNNPASAIPQANIYHITVQVGECSVLSFISMIGHCFE